MHLARIIVNVVALAAVGIALGLAVSALRAPKPLAPVEPAWSRRRGVPPARVSTRRRNATRSATIFLIIGLILLAFSGNLLR